MIPGGEEKCENLRKSCRDFSLSEGIAFQHLAIKPYAFSTVEKLQLAISGKKMYIHPYLVTKKTYTFDLQ